MVIFESSISTKSFKLKPETEVLSGLARFIGPIWEFIWQQKLLICLLEVLMSN
jgi:hypothetical protein